MAWLAGALIISGASLAVVAAVGLNRFDDVFARLHSATKPATLGLLLVLAGSALQVPDPGDVAKILLVLLLNYITAPVGGHMLSRAAFHVIGHTKPVLGETGEPLEER